MSSYFDNIKFENWIEEDVANWLKGLDDAVHQYIPAFVDRKVDGKSLLMITHSDLETLGVTKLGHQELILEGVDLLKSLCYSFETENLQHLALQLGCKARSLHNEILAKNGENDPNRANVQPSRHHRRQLSISVLSSVCDIITTLKTLTSWLDRAPFESIYEINLFRNSIVKLGLELVLVSQKESSLIDVENEVVRICKSLTDYCDDLVIHAKESLIVQPASLEMATIRKKQDDELGMNIHSLYMGVHQIGFIKDGSPAEFCNKIEKGDEVIQVNDQTVLGWQLAKLVDALKKRPKEVTILMKKRPRHSNPYGTMPKPRQPRHNVPSVATLPKSLKKKKSKDGEKPARPTLPEFVTSSVPTGDIFITKESPEDPADEGNDTDNDVFRSGSESPQYTLPVLVDTKQRRATVSGGSPTFERPSLVVEDLDPMPARPKSQAINVLEKEAAIKALLSSDSGLKRTVERKSVSDSLLDEKEKDLALKKEMKNLKEANEKKTDDEKKEVEAVKEEIIKTVASDNEAAVDRTEQSTVEKMELDVSAKSQDVLVTKPVVLPLDQGMLDKKSRIRQQKIVSTEIAADKKGGDIPQLVRIKRLDSTQINEMEQLDDDVFAKPGKKVVFTESPKDGFAHVVVGGVVQKIPLEKTNSGESGVKMRTKTSSERRVDRRVSCKDLGKGDCEGWLYKRRHRDRALTKHWAKRWCVLKNNNLFYYKNKDEMKADGVIHLPAFQVSPTSLSKGKKKFAFKIHNAGASFYFASESREDMSKWMNKTGLAAISYNVRDNLKTAGFVKPEVQTSPKTARAGDFSESDDDDDAESLGASSMSLASISSVGSSTVSPQDSPQVRRRRAKDEVKDKSDDSQEGLHSMLRSIEKHDLTIDGQNKAAQRQSKIKAVQGTEPDEVEKLRRLRSLQRTLKAKEQEVKDIEKMLEGPVTQSRLHEFMESHQD